VNDKKTITIKIVITPALRIRDVSPGSYFFHPGSRIRVKKVPDHGSKFATNNLSIFYPKKFYSALGKYDPLDVHPGSRIRNPDMDFFRPEYRGKKSTGSWFLIRNTAAQNLQTFKVLMPRYRNPSLSRKRPFPSLETFILALLQIRLGIG
jgi:hypothetical protein